MTSFDKLASSFLQNWLSLYQSNATQASTEEQLLSFKTDHTPSDITAVPYLPDLSLKLSVFPYFAPDSTSDGNSPQHVSKVTPEQQQQIKSGLDGKDRMVVFTLDELIEFSNMDDPREAITRKAFEHLAYHSPNSQEAVSDYINSIRDLNGKVAIYWGNTDEVNKNIDVKELKTAILNEVKIRLYEKAVENAKKNNVAMPPQPKLITLNGDSSVDRFGSYTIAASTRQQVYEGYLNKFGTNAEKALYAKERLEAGIDLKVEEAKSKLQKQFDALKNGNNLNNAYVDLAYQTALKEEIDRIVAETKADFRGDGWSKYLGDASETVMRAVIDKHPAMRFLPEPMKEQMVRFGIGVEKGAISIGAGISGAGAFINDAIEDTVLYSLKSAGVSTEGYEKQMAEQRGSRARFWQELSSLSTKSMSQADKAYVEKIEQGLRMTPYDLPNKSTGLGQSVPSIALGAATGGGSLATQIAISAAMQTMLAGGESYALTNSRGEAFKVATIAGVQGAIAPVTARLPLPADLATNALMTYTTGKLAGKDENAIFVDIMQQTALSGGFRAGTKLNEWLAAKEGKSRLSADEAKAAMGKYKKEWLGVLSEETSKSFGKQVRELQAKVSVGIEQAKASYGLKNRTYTKSRYEEAGRIIQAAKVRAVAGLMTTGGSGLGAVDGRTLGALKDRAGYHIEAGLRGFGQFIEAMRSDVNGLSLSVRDLEEVYRETTGRLGIRADEIGIARAKVTGRSDAELKADLDPTVRRGETVREATERVNLAREEIKIRGHLMVYDSMRSGNQKINLRGNDISYGDSHKAHTIERHGPDLLPERAGAPAGVRTVEGRIYGDAPWGRAENNSYKWIDEATMNRTINDYIQSNLDEICWTLATRRELAVTFDAGKLVGEGYYNEGQGGFGPRNAKYGQTSYVRLVLKLDQIEPMKIVVVTAYPSAKPPVKGE
jgi:hypothetical protein